MSSFQSSTVLKYLQQIEAQVSVNPLGDPHAPACLPPGNPPQSAAIELHVESGLPSNVQYDGVVVHDWSSDGRLVRYRVYVDKVLPSSDPDYI